jgi:hypothetical protein
MRLALLSSLAALLIGLGIGLAAMSGGASGSAGVPKPAGVKLQRLQTPSVGAIAVPALKVPRAKTPTSPTGSGGTTNPGGGTTNPGGGGTTNPGSGGTTNPGSGGTSNPGGGVVTIDPNGGGTG